MSTFRFGYGTICILHSMHHLSDYSFHALFTIPEEADEFLRKVPPIGDFLAFRVPDGWTAERLFEVASSVDADGKLPRGVRQWKSTTV